MNIFEKLDRPEWLDKNICLLSLGGSRVYGCATDESDYDYIGICTMPEPYLKPEKYGYIYGFDQLPKFDNFVATGVTIDDKLSDVTVYGLPNYFKLLVGGNPNVIEPLFTKDSEVTDINSVGQRLRENRKLFVAKNLIKNILAYAVSQLKRVDREPEGKRMLLVEKYGYDTKSMSHVVRLLDNCEQLLITNDMFLDFKGDLMKQIRNGFYDLTLLKMLCTEKIKTLEVALANSSLPDRPPVEQVRDLLKECLK